MPTQTTDPNELSPSSEQGNQQGEESQQNPTPPTENQPAPVTETLINGRTPEQHARYIELLEGTLREQSAKISSLAERVEQQVQPQAPPAPQKSEQELNQEWYNRPAGMTRELIREELGNLQQDFKSTIDPLVEFVRGMRGEGTPFTTILNRLKADPRFAQAQITPDVEAAAQDILRNNRADVTEQNVMAAIVQAQGLKSMNMLVGYSSQAPAPTPPPQPTMGNQPAHLRPSAPPGPRQPTPEATLKSKIDNLGENEKRIVREQFKGDYAEYFKWRDHGGTDSATFNSYTTGSAS